MIGPALPIVEVVAMPLLNCAGLPGCGKLRSGGNGGDAVLILGGGGMLAPDGPIVTGSGNVVLPTGDVPDLCK